tara:strand:- start:539 stop:1432 length:894 start_codon:yes stop_codon:yes gene_type:complete
MIKNVLVRVFVSLPLLVAVVNAQDGVDAIEKARQAKEAADKAAAEAAAATEAAIEAAAAKAAKAAREDAKKKKEEEEARKIAEAKAAEEAELDAAASAAAEEAKRRMAAELGLEVASDEKETSDDESTVAATEDEAEEVIAKESSGWNLGLAASVGLLSGETFTNVPTGGTVVLTTPFGFKLGPFDYTVSIGFGNYSGNYEPEDPETPTVTFDPSFVGLGGNLTLANFVFAEGHIGTVGEGTGFRGFAGVTLERLMKNINLPVNLLIGSEAFFSTDMAGVGNSSGWASLGIRLDYGL